MLSRAYHINYTFKPTTQHKGISCLIIERDSDSIPYAVPIHNGCWSPSKPADSISPVSYSSPTGHLVLLALSLETERLVDPEFPGDGEEGHADGDAVDVLDYVL